MEQVSLKFDIGQSIQQRRDILDRPELTRHAGRHRWGNPERLVDAHEIVVHEVQSHRRLVAGKLLGKRVGQSGEPPHRHAHGEVLPLDVARADVLRIGIAGDILAPNADALSRAVALLSLWRGAVQLLQQGIVNIVAERFLDRLKIRLVAVAGELHAAGQALAQIIDESQRILAIASADHPARHQLGIGTDGRPGPGIASAVGRGLRGRHVLGLRIGERPDFVDLDALARQVTQMRVLIGRTGSADVHQQLGDRVLGSAGDAHRGADAVALHEAADDLGALGCGEPVHVLNVRAAITLSSIWITFSIAKEFDLIYPGH